MRDDNPCIFLEPKILYRSAVEHVPVDDYTLDLEKADVLVPGTDVTLVGKSTGVREREIAIERQVPSWGIVLNI